MDTKMNSNKRNYAWILCPSKTFSGKFYYFNMLTGEAAWSLNEIEMKVASQNKCIHKINEKWHNYPEPDSPPIREGFTNGNWQCRKPEHFSQPCINHPQVFGQAFPKCASNVDERFANLPNYWPQTHPSMYTSPVAKRPRIDCTRPWETRRDFCQNCERQTLPIEKPRPNQQNLFNYKICDSSTPVKNQCECNMKNQNSFLSKSTEPVFKQNMFKTLVPQTNCTFKINKTDVHTPKMVIKESVFNRKRTNSECTLTGGKLFGSFENLNAFEDCSKIDKNQMKYPSSGFIKKNLSASLENLAKTSFDTLKSKSPIKDSKLASKNNSNATFDDSAYFDMSNISPRKRSVCDDTLDSKVVFKRLPKNDLRHRLLARTKNPSFGDKNPFGKGKLIKMANSHDKIEVTPKKRVTFDLGVDEAFSDDTQDANLQDPHMSEGLEEQLTISTLKGLAKVSVNPDCWYIVVDADSLLDEYQFLDSLVRSDENCILLIPHAVRSQIEAMSVGDCQGRDRVMVARQVSRRLATLDPHITVQSPVGDGNIEVINKEIINCCLQAIDQKYHVVLITKNEELYSDAQSACIDCFELQDLKDNLTQNPELSFEITKVLKTEDVDKDQNFFISVSNERNPFVKENKKHFPVNCFRKRLFESDNNCENKNKNCLFFENDNVITSSIQTENNKNKEKAIKSADCDFKANTSFPPKTFRNEKEQNQDIDNSHVSFEINRIGTKFQNLKLKETNKELKTQDGGCEKQRIEIKQATVTSKQPANVLKFKNINAYTIDEHLKRFNIKTKVVEDRIKLRIEEWACVYTQIMEEVLSEVLTYNMGRHSNIKPPWSLAEAMDSLRDLYSEHTSVRLITDKLSDMLANCSYANGKLKCTTKPSDFMKIFGCGVILVQCLMNILPDLEGLTDAESSLEKLLENMSDPATDPEPPQVMHTPIIMIDDQEPHEERRNIIKKPSEVIQYLKKYFPEWQAYKESGEENACKNTQQVKPEKPKIIRTVGKNLNIVNLKNKSMSFVSQDKHEAEIEVNKENKTKININNNIEVKDPKNYMIGEAKKAGAKYLKQLALNPDVPPKMKEIDIEKREKINKGMLDMLNKMINITDNAPSNEINKDINEETTDNEKGVRKDATFKSANTNDGSIILNIPKENTAARKENITPKIIRQFNVNFNYKPNNVADKTDLILLDEISNKNTFGKIENDGPKVIRNIKLIDAFEERLKKSKELDLDALDYSAIENSIIDNSSYELVIDENPELDKNKPDIIENKENGTKSPNIVQGTKIGQNNDSVTENNENTAQNTDNCDVDASNGTTDDSGFENGSVHAYSLVKTFLTELSGSFKNIYQFIDASIHEFRVEDIQEDRKKLLHEKANKTYTHLSEIITSLKSIIQRETTNGATLKGMLVRAGVQAAGDKRMTRYRQVVTKCLEQAQMLETALKIMVNMTDCDFEVNSMTSISSDCNKQYYNIFE